MKKIFTVFVVAFVSVATYAQTTFNVRVGGGGFHSHCYSYEDVGFVGGLALAFEANIPLGSRMSRVVFSPSFMLLTDFDVCGINVPFHVGYKVPFGNGSFFIPKAGLMMGYNVDYDVSFALGPSVELAFEIKHFIVALNGYVDPMDDAVKAGIIGTIGYKF